MGGKWIYGCWFRRRPDPCPRSSTPRRECGWQVGWITGESEPNPVLNRRSSRCPPARPKLTGHRSRIPGVVQALLEPELYLALIYMFKFLFKFSDRQDKGSDSYNDAGLKFGLRYSDNWIYLLPSKSVQSKRIYKWPKNWNHWCNS
jgi:hypothetical protein